MTKGQSLTATLRRSFGINSRSRSYRDGVNIKEAMLDAITNATTIPGYYSEAKTATYSAAWGTVCAYRKHVDGYRVDGMVAYRIQQMTPWEFAGLLGSMVDAGVDTTGAGETYFAQMRRTA